MEQPTTIPEITTLAETMSANRRMNLINQARNIAAVGLISDIEQSFAREMVEELLSAAQIFQRKVKTNVTTTTDITDQL